MYIVKKETNDLIHKKMPKKNRRNFISQLGIGVGAGLLGINYGQSKGKDENCTMTPIQDQGPFPVMEFRSQQDHDIDLTRIKGNKEVAKGTIITLHGVVKDKDCNTIAGAVVEIWQANHFGKYRHEFQDKGKSDPNFQGWGQAVTNERGEYRFTTIIPGEYGNRARHIHFKIARRGYHELITQLYFDGEPRNKTDGILNRLTHEEQLQVIMPFANGKISFDPVLEKVESGKVSEKVLKEYTGTYLPKDPAGMAEYIKELTGKTYKKYWLKLTHKGEQIFLSFPFIDPVEIGWYAKDEFQSWAYENSWITFQRNDAGKVKGLHLNFGEDQFVEFIKEKVR